MNFIIENEPVIRLVAFLGLLIIFSGLEFIIPLAKRRSSRPKQWFTNLSIVAIDTICLRLLFPVLAVGVASHANNKGMGVFNIIDLNFTLTVVLSVLLMDLLIYGQHVMMHKFPLLWRLHRMHHCELGLDATSALRFHPIEIIISMVIKMAFVFIMGIPVVAVIIFEVVLNGLAIFNHSNIKLPSGLEKIIRHVIITPELHWVHHSEISKETHSNFGFNLSIWDKIFSTYIDKPTIRHDSMRQGLVEFGFDKPLNIIELLISPFKEYPVDKK